MIKFLIFVLLFFIQSNFNYALPDDFSGKADFPFTLNENDKLWVENTLSKMTLKEKCAQMVFSYATSLDTNFESRDYLRLEKLVKDFKVGGLIFFQGNAYNQILITNRLQSQSEIPLIISADFERGPGMRLDDIVQFPHNMALGAANDTYLTYMMGKYTAQYSRAIGVQLNFAPLLDVNHDFRNPVINIRAYSDDPNIISWHGNAFIKGMHEGGMITTAKHFPGHGATDLDSHLSLPIINLTMDELEKTDLVPFKEAIAAGVKAVMIGHLNVPALDFSYNTPATLSPDIIDYLKDELNFGGLIITDALNMRAVADSFSIEDLVKKAVIAGNDILLFPSDDSLAIEGIYNAVKSNEISINRIDESARKILSAKKWLNLDVYNQVNLSETKELLKKPDQRRLAEIIAEKSITLVKDDISLIPLNPRDYLQTASISISTTRFKGSLKEAKVIEKLIDKNFGYVKSSRLNLSAKDKDYDEALSIAKKSDLIILNMFLSGTYVEENKIIDDGQKSLISKLLSLKKPVLVLNLGNPYLLKEFQEAKTYLCSYSFTDVSQEAMFNAILGRNEISGMLPVSIPGTDYKTGFGIKRYFKLPVVPDNFADTNYIFSSIDSIMSAGIIDTVFPGADVLIGYNKKVIYHKQFGKNTYEESSQKITSKSLFDLASVTKVTGTTSAAMILFDIGLLDIEKPVCEYLPAFRSNGKDKITIRHLLTHNSGLPAFKRYYTMDYSRDDVINDIMNTELIFEPGSDYTYSDLGMITMQFVIEKITGMPLDQFLKTNLFDKLNMKSTMYNPPPEKWFYCVPTEVDNYWRHTLVKGKVHDENAFLLGGVAGHAGLFSTASDLARLMFVYANGGMYDNKQIFKQSTIDLFTKVQSRYGQRGFGWDVKSKDGYSSAGPKFSTNSFGHTGFTGTSIWMDKDRNLFVILLTNRVHPTRDNKKISRFRPQLHDAIIDAVSFK